MKNWIYYVKSKLSIDSYIDKAKARGLSNKIPLEILNKVKLGDWVTYAKIISDRDKSVAQIFLEFHITVIDHESVAFGCHPGAVRIVSRPNPILVGVKYQRGLNPFDREHFWRVVRQFVRGRRNIKLKIKARFDPK